MYKKERNLAKIINIHLLRLKKRTKLISAKLAVEYSNIIKVQILKIQARIEKISKLKNLMKLKVQELSQVRILKYRFNFKIRNPR